MNNFKGVDYKTLCQIAKKTNSKSKLLKLCELDDVLVEDCLVNRKDLFLELAENLYKKEYHHSALAWNPSCPPQILEKLSLSLDPTIRNGVANNPNTPEYILGKLLNDSYDYIQEGVVWNASLSIKMQMEIFSKHIGNLDRVLFRRKDLAPAIEREAIKRSLALRRFIAMKRTTSLGVLTILSKDSEVKIRYAVASNINTPKEVLTYLAADKNFGVRMAIAKNKESPIEAIDILINRKSKSRALQNVLRKRVSGLISL